MIIMNIKHDLFVLLIKMLFAEEKVHKENRNEGYVTLGFHQLQNKKLQVHLIGCF